MRKRPRSKAPERNHQKKFGTSPDKQQTQNLCLKRIASTSSKSLRRVAWLPPRLLLPTTNSARRRSWRVTTHYNKLYSQTEQTESPPQRADAARRPRNQRVPTPFQLNNKHISHLPTILKGLSRSGARPKHRLIMHRLQFTLKFLHLYTLNCHPLCILRWRVIP